MGKQAVYGEAEMQRVVLSFRESGMSLRKFAKFCRIPESTMRRWVKMERPEKKARRTNRPKYPEVESDVHDWMEVEKTSGHVVTTAEIQAKAKEIAEAKGIEGFQGSNGWVYRLKHKKEKDSNEEAVPETSAGETSSASPAKDFKVEKKKKKKIAPHPAATASPSKKVVEKSRSRNGSASKGNKNASKKSEKEEKKKKEKTKEKKDKKEKKKKSSKKRSSPEKSSSKYVVITE